MKPPDWNAQYLDDPAPWPGPDAILAEVAGSLTPGRALDLGCGKGGDALWLARHGWRVTCVDQAPAGIAVARGLAAEQGLDLDARVADATTFRAEPVFDLVYVGFLHLPEPDRSRLFANAAAAVAPGGTFLYVAFARDNQPGVIPPPPACLAMPEDVTRHLPGFDIPRAQVLFRRVPVPGRVIAANGIVVRARRRE